ncbi:hemerythrin family protein [Pseudaeromonas sp. ZJS20]|uniref:bacteriohemerythrin n=1 Tax=Pseudaeromonas aegiceratis TaxID=3153928 RepID=UPI00390CB0E0
MVAQHPYPSHPSGHPLLDHQHQELARQLVQLEALLADPADETQLLTSLTALDRQIREHFRCEEQLMADQHYPQLAQHHLQHQQIAQQADALLRQYHKGQVSLAELVSRFLQEVAAPHIREDDAELLRYLHHRARG